MDDVNYFMGIIHCTFYTADNYGVKCLFFITETGFLTC